MAGVEIGPSAFSFIAPDTRKASATRPRKTHEMIFIGLLFYSDFLNPSMRVWAVPDHHVGVSILRRSNRNWCLIGTGKYFANSETRGSQLQVTLRSPLQVQFESGIGNGVFTPLNERRVFLTVIQMRATDQHN